MCFGWVFLFLSSQKRGQVKSEIVVRLSYLLKDNWDQIYFTLVIASNLLCHLHFVQGFWSSVQVISSFSQRPLVK